MVTTGARGVKILVGVLAALKALLDIQFGNALDGVTEFLGENLGRIGVDDIVDRVHLALLHQQFDDVNGAFGHAVGEFLDRYGLRDNHFARPFLGRHLKTLGLFLLALGAAAECRERTALLLTVLERVGNSQLATATFRVGLGARRSELHLAFYLGAPPDLFILGFGLLWSAWLELARGFLGAALGFGLALVAGFLFGFARIRGLALTALNLVVLQAPLGVLLGVFPLLGFAHARIGERPLAGFLLVVGQGAQHHAGAGER